MGKPITHWYSLRLTWLLFYGAIRHAFCGKGTVIDLSTATMRCAEGQPASKEARDA